MDSFCLRQLVKPDKIIYVNTGTVDGKEEMKLLPKDTIVVDFNLTQFELANKIIPQRNALFILIASQFGNEIYIGATKGDTTKDKDYIFKAQMEGLLNYFAIDKNKVNIKEYPYIVHMPYKDMTKSQILKQYIAIGGSIEDLKKHSRSCYSAGQECGKCRSCLRKATALGLNGIDYRAFFMQDPAVLDYLTSEQIIKEINREGEGEDLQRWLKLKQ